MIEDNSYSINFEQMTQYEPMSDYSDFKQEEEGMLIVADDQPEIQSSLHYYADDQQSAFLTPQINVPKTNKFQKISKTYRFPRESKNYYKNIGPKLREFIIESFDQSIQIQLKDFLDVQNQKHNKQHFKKLCMTKLGQTIAKSFFRNFRWAKYFVTDDLNTYFRLNDDWQSTE